MKGEKNGKMINILREWEGKFEVDGEEKDNLDEVQFQDGEQIDIRLIPDRSENYD